jgi:hypothetical protein
VATPLNEVFGIATHVNAASYVDRGGLDKLLGYYLRTERHVAIHGDSKQGKSWLRSNLLDADDTLVVQCGVESSPESLFREALGQLDIRAEIKRVGTSQLEGQLDIRGSGELGNVLVGKAKLDIGAGGKVGKGNEVETEPIGQTPADLSWVARILKASQKRLVIEDFHYVSEANRRAFAFMLKALGDYGVYVIVVGIWPEDHLLTYYNGDLDGRVEDIRLVWEDEDLKAVLEKGCEALKIEFADELKEALIRDAYGNVGLVQRLAEHVCLAADILEGQAELITIDANGQLEKARGSVSRSMKARYDAFADNFVRGMKRMTEGLEVYKHMLRAFTAGTTEELLDGIDSRDLLTRIQEANPEATIRQSDLTQALDRVDRLQAKIEIRPQVLTYNRDRRRLFLADRSFLFYRKYGTPSWPWEKDDTLLAALGAAPEGEQLNLDDLEFTDRALEELADVAAAEADGGSAEATGGGADAAAPPGDQPTE